MIISKTDLFFNEVIPKQDFAMVMRRFMHATLCMYLDRPDDCYKEYIEEGYAYMTDFLEEIDPQLSKNNISNI